MKKEKFFFMICIIFIFVNLCSCKTETEGNTLQAFSNRMNKLSEDYGLSPSGFIYDSDKKTISKFFTTDKREILVQFLINDESELCRMNIVFDNLTEDNHKELEFICHCITSFINNKEISENLLSEINFYTEIYNPSYDTLHKKNGDTEIFLDVTEAGTVITVVQNNP